MNDQAFFYAVVCAPLYLGGLLGLWLLIAPGAVLKWRSKILKDKQRGRIGGWVERRLRAEGPAPWEDQSAISRMKIVGLAVLLKFAAAGYLLAIEVRPRF